MFDWKREEERDWKGEEEKRGDREDDLCSSEKEKRIVRRMVLEKHFFFITRWEGGGVGCMNCVYLYIGTI